MRKIALSMLIVLFLLFSMVVTASAQLRTVGVVVGNYFKYDDVSAEWTSNDPNSTPPSTYLTINDTEWIEIVIIGIYGPNVTVQQTTDWKNGTLTQLYGWINIDTGDGLSFQNFLVSANLSSGDSEYSSSTYSSLKINSTTTENILGGLRQVNHYNETDWSLSDSTLYNETVKYSWDRSTGAVIEISRLLSQQTPQYTSTLSYHFRMTSSNVVPEFPTLTSILLILILLTPAILVLSKRKLRKKPIH